ncbi:hypothetical protein [Cyclobacterium roseum]|uniref:hypothetical protein n=1 Tax=Cyclobacterium roseum TaxID=2666137 RepID=UPI0013920732|nr:hypothetical protein [Cyclobacterium roseum]
MNFIDISDLNILTDLDVLKRDTQPNSFLLYQHKGGFFADNDRIGNANQKRAHTKFLEVLEKARQDNIALVLSPEYSCPKSVIDFIIGNKKVHPPLNKVWVLGGESISKEEITQLLAVNQDDILIHCEDVISNTDKRYSDPLYYVFNGEHSGIPKLIILIQFKTRHMGVWGGGKLEADNLIEGNDIYIIKNSNSSTRLVSFICSEAMNVRQELTPDVKDNILDWNDKPFLILNPQINPNPSHIEFIRFRDFIFEGNKKEIISLNWGKETFFNNKPWYPKDINTPRSGVFFKTSDVELDYSPNTIINNHKKGFYFLHIIRNKFVYFLNGTIELIKIENKPVDIIEGVAQQRRREGPEAKIVYAFDVGTSNFTEQQSIDDQHIEFFNQRGITNSFLLNADNSIVDKERLINISTGKIIGKLENKWCEVLYLNSFNLKEADECNCRMTYVEDTYTSSEMIRTLNCTYLIELDETILPDKSQYPESIKDLAYHNIILSYSQDASTYKYKYNLTNQNGDTKMATVCYLGNVSASQVKNTYDELQKLFDEGTESKRRIVVFYKNGTDLRSKYDETAGSFTTPSNDNSSIL